MFTRRSSEIKSELDPILDEVIQIIFQDKTVSCTHEKSSVYSHWAIQAVISLNFSKKDSVLTLGNTPKLRLVKHQTFIACKGHWIFVTEATEDKPPAGLIFLSDHLHSKRGP